MNLQLMNIRHDQSGKIKLGLVLLVFLLGLVAGQLTYRYMTRANRLNDEAVDLMNQGKYDTALKILAEALEIQPRHTQANFHQGICLAERHRFDEALEAFTRVALLDPSRADAHYQQGRILWMLKRYDKAIAPLQKATDIQNNYPNAWIVLAESLYEKHLRRLIEEPDTQSSPAQAEAAFKTYLKQRASAPDKHIVERKLKILAHLDRYPEVLEKRRQMMEWEAKGNMGHDAK
ncbi:MAG: tetratricopeptide repeat protein [Deltaproteobacteria bacterium]|nr:tetratricopeptide repeat protein [Deltaproteobacteria bacterium]